MLIPINRNTHDPFYRYKMPQLITKQQGKSKNVKTVLVNIGQISNALKRKEVLLQQFILYELSVNSMAKDSMFMLKGDYAASEIQDIVYEFIGLLVQCKECDNPETEMGVEGDEVSLCCYACGCRRVVESNHRIMNYVRKNPEVAEYKCYGEYDDRNEGVHDEDKSVQKDEDALSLEHDVLQSLNENFSSFYMSHLPLKHRIIKASFNTLINDRGRLNVYEKVFRQDEEALTLFFENLEVYLVENDKIKEMKVILDSLPFLDGADFNYFKKKSKVVDKKASVRIRNTLLNYINYK
ncbi:hypothetical protein VCUG_00453 [Vavraia culicis subsp. floridensis]|uniref:Translation initiation factor IF2/IF5 domain-containing protein n=1 Tax=Vavraia culicis (isolate floridensis) TaxID=948595 RepID=L2GY62_VAVCU|nr:uncharacterized protein VCUG_00453 [Vavraia culicis subsp. floridensis]ELA48030.1 hypothetical protein VCUG_00453 [Vavraia culicis subsp. floridensis]